MASRACLAHRLPGRGLSGVAITLVLSVWSITLAAAGERIAVPDDAQLKSATEAVRDAYRKELEGASSPVEAAKLSRRLLDDARDVDDPAEQYAVYETARTLAVTSGDPSLCVEVSRAVGERFDVDRWELASRSLRDAAANVRSADAPERFAETALVAAESATLDDHFDGALSLVEIARLSATKARDNELKRRAAEVKKELASAQKRFAQIAPALERLSAEPADPTANSIVGRYRCFDQKRWEAGLAHLAQSGEADLELLAQQEFAQPQTPAEQAGLANGWWQVAETLEGPPQQAVVAHAGEWYERAYFGVTGKNKAHVGQRLGEISRRLGPPWEMTGIKSFVEEQCAIDHPDCPDELDARFEAGALIVDGTCKHNTKKINGKVCGWFGKVAVWKVKRPFDVDARFEIEPGNLAHVVILSAKGAELGRINAPKRTVAETVSLAYDGARGEVRMTVRRADQVVEERSCKIDRREGLFVALGATVRKPGDQCWVRARLKRGK